MENNTDVDATSLDGSEISINRNYIDDVQDKSKDENDTTTYTGTSIQKYKSFKEYFAEYWDKIQAADFVTSVSAT